MSAPAWIAVAETLPEPLIDVLVHHYFAWEAEDCASVDLAYRQRDGRWVLTGADPEIEIRPTHWMPLPAPPAARVLPAAAGSGRAAA